MKAPDKIGPPGQRSNATVEAAIYLTTAMPENFAWLTEADGKRVGISAEISRWCGEKFKHAPGNQTTIQ